MGISTNCYKSDCQLRHRRPLWDSPGPDVRVQGARVPRQARRPGGVRHRRQDGHLHALLVRRKMTDQIRSYNF